MFSTVRWGVWQKQDTLIFCSGHRYSCLRSSCSSEDVAERRLLLATHVLTFKHWSAWNFLNSTSSPSPGPSFENIHTTLPSRGFQPGHSRETGLGKRSHPQERDSEEEESREGGALSRGEWAKERRLEIKTGVTVRLRCGARRALRQMGFHNLVRAPITEDFTYQKEKKIPVFFLQSMKELPLRGTAIFSLKLQILICIPDTDIHYPFKEIISTPEPCRRSLGHTVLGPPPIL